MISSDRVQKVWEKAEFVPGYDPSKWRKDFAGAWIRRDLYGTTQNYGWEVDHLVSRANCGSNDIENLVPLHWRNNRAKGTNAPTFVTEISSDGNKNVERRRRWLLP